MEAVAEKARRTLNDDARQLDAEVGLYQLGGWARLMIRSGYISYFGLGSCLGAIFCLKCTGRNGFSEAHCL